MSDGFVDILTSCQAAAQAYDPSSQDWLPPDGKYTVLFENLDKGTKLNDAGVNCAWFRPTFRILPVTGNEPDKSFSGRPNFMYIEPNQTDPNDRKAQGLKRLLRFASCLAGETIKDPAAAVSIMEANVGAMLEVTLESDTYKGKPFTKMTYLNRLENFEVAESAVA